MLSINPPRCEMVGKKRPAPGGARRRTGSRGSGSPSSSSAAPRTGKTIYSEMIAEVATGAVATAASSGSPERPAKRKRPGEKIVRIQPQAEAVDQEVDEDDDIQFEDVPIPEPTVQTMTKDSDDEDDDEEDDNLQFEDVDLGALAGGASENERPQELDLNLTAQRAAMAPPRRAIERRKAIGREEKERRVEIHKMHLLSFLAHVERRNNWCNDPKVHDALEPLLTGRVVKLLNPSASLTQFGRTESLKNGLQELRALFKVKFKITERGLRRALWAETEDQLKNV